MIRRLKKGYWYWNGHEGLRVITSIDVHGHIHYVVKAAHLEVTWDSKASRVVSVINRQAKCHPRWFAIWAKVELSPEEGEDMLRKLRARRVLTNTTKDGTIEAKVTKTANDCKGDPTKNSAQIRLAT